MGSKKLQRIPLSAITIPEWAIRAYDNDHEMDLLVREIRQHGLLQPIRVRKVHDGYELVYGSRRCMAANKAGFNEIDAVVDEGADEKEAFLKHIAENAFR